MVFLTLRSVKKGGNLRKDGLKYYKDDVISDKKAKEGDILLANTDLSQDGNVIGYPILVPEFNREICFSHHISKLVGDYSQFNERYLFEFLRTTIVHNRMRAFSAGSTVLNLDSTSAERINILIPSREEQRRIAEILSTVDDTIQKEQQIKTELEALKRGLMQDLLTGKVRFPVEA